jgi:2-C-methyl-D-erythritol 2,4-cyclodiphosphate synthase
MFPDTAAAWKDADSWKLLHHIAQRVLEADWQIENVDAVVIAQRPKLSPHIAAMRERIATAIATTSECVNVRGKTAEGLGALGAGEGIAVHAVCLLIKQ